MNRLNRMADKVAAMTRTESQIPIDNSVKCMEAYFDILDYCDEHVLDKPPQPGAPGAVDAYRELFGKISARCSFADFWRWFTEEPQVEDHILPRRDDSIILMEEYFDGLQE